MEVKVESILVVGHDQEGRDNPELSVKLSVGEDNALWLKPGEILKIEPGYIMIKDKEYKIIR